MNTKKNKKLGIVLPLLGAVIVSVLVSGATVKAADGLTALDKLIQLLQLAKEADQVVINAPSLGANFTVDDTPTANFNNLALMTDPLTSGNNNYNNFVIERMSLVDQANSSTPLSIKNTWALPLVVSDLLIMGDLGNASSTLTFWYAGTSTVSGVANTLATSSIPNALVNGRGLGAVANAATVIDSNFASSTLAGSEHVSIVVQPGEYFVVHCRAHNAQGSCLRAATGFSDIRVTAQLKGIATSTSQY